MALSIACPGCDADYSVPENLVGKTIRCKSCGESILVKAVKAKAGARSVRDDDEDDDDRPRNKTRPAPARSRRDEDDEEDDTPAKKSNKPMIAFGLAALLIAGGVGGYFALAGGKDESKPVANLDRGGADRGTGREAAKPTPDGVAPGTDVAPKKDDVKKDDVKKDDVKKDDANAVKTGDTASAEVKPEEKKPEEKKPEDKPKDTTAKADTAKPDEAKTAPGVKVVDKADKISDRPITGVVSGQTGMDALTYSTGIMPPNVLTAVKKASVFIFAESGGGAGTGSGWFGIEPGIVFTNAHVLHMTAPNAPPPKKITFTLNSGQKDEREIPHSKIKILAVDREIDIAALQVINEPDLPSPLRVRPSLECSEGLRLSTVGYPFGSRPVGISGQGTHKPEVSIRATSITAFRRNDYGMIRRIQFEGAANPGNSGGPLVDAEGTVCTVVVEGVHTTGHVTGGIALSMGVPTEYCFGLLAGRAYETKTEIAYKDGDNVRIPIKIKCLDPMKRLKSVGVAAWIGNPSTKYRTPGAAKPATEPGDRDYIETELKYDATTQLAVGEIVLPKKPDGTVYWIQPYYSNAIVTRYWQPGEMYKHAGEAADREDANLVFKPSAGRIRSVTMSTAALQPGDGEDSEGEGQSSARRVLFRFGLNVAEEVKVADANDTVQAAKFILKFQSLHEPKAVVNGGDEQLLPKGLHDRVNTEVKKCGAIALVNKTGQVYKHSLNLVNVPNIGEKIFVDWFASSAVESLTATSIELPNRVVKPDETWVSTHDGERIIQDPLPTDRQGRPLPGATMPAPRKYRYTEKVTMKYIGTRLRDGRKEAMVLVDGKILTASASTHVATGSIRGYAFVELDTGTVLQSHIDKEYDIDTSEKGHKKSVVGIFKFDLKRSSSTN